MNSSTSNAGLYAAAALIGALTITAMTQFEFTDDMFWVLGLGLVLFAITLLAPDTEGDTARITSFIKKRDNAIVYSVVTKAVLNRLARMITPNSTEYEPCPQHGNIARFLWHLTPRAIDTADRNRLRANPWSWPILDVALRLAVIYPILLILAQWTLVGGGVGFGDNIFLLNEPKTWVRFLVIGTLIFCVTARLVDTLLRGSKGGVSFALFLLVVLAIASSLPVRTLVELPNSYDAAKFILIILVSIVAGGFFLLALPISIAMGAAAVGIFHGTNLGQFEVGIAVVVIQMASLFLVYSVGALAGFASRKGLGVLGIFAGVTFLFALVSSAFTFLSPEAVRLQGSTVFVLGLLPLLNGVFDYLSYAITLTLIKFGTAQKNMLSFGVALVDIVAAYVLLVALACTVALTLAFINHIVTQPFLDLSTLIADLKNPVVRHQYSWLYLAFFSTLIPTGFHLIIGLLSTTTWIPFAFKSWVAEQISSTGTGSFGTILGGIVVAVIGAGWCYAIAYILRWGWGWTFDNIEWLGLGILSHVEFFVTILGVL